MAEEKPDEVLPEAVALRWKDVDLLHHQIYVHCFAVGKTLRCLCHEGRCKF
ncbi:hypothetical protein KE530_01095 [Clostridiaceae bacterium Marseille-Q4145]|nr:hypothetical protein [Clostridiaceae bacterium Marseille-Q4145]